MLSYQTYYKYRYGETYYGSLSNAIKHMPLVKEIVRSLNFNYCGNTNDTCMRHQYELRRHF